MSDALVLAFDRLVDKLPQVPLLVSHRRPVLRVEDVAALARATALSLPADLGSGAIVGLLAPNGPAFLAGLIALRRRGLPALLLDPQSPAAEVRRIAQALGARGLLTTNDAWPPDGKRWTLERLAREHAPLLPESIATLRLTSGSTGGPRGIALTGDALLADDAALTASMSLRDDERILAAIPMSHAYGFASIVLPALVRGALIVIPDSASPLGPLQAADQARATVFPTVPAYAQALLRISRPPAWPASVRLVICAGARLPPEVAARFRATYGQPLHAFYGASECGGICYDREGGAGERGTVGAPVEGARVTLEPVAGALQAGEGLVTVASAAVGSAYLPDGNSHLGDGQFQTSDVGCWSGGELRLLRRIDALINVKGKKVDPAEIEAILAGLTGVDEVVALSIAAPEPGGQMLRVVIACRQGCLTYGDVLDWCRPRLADYKIPRSILLVRELPRTPRGKLDRPALLKLDPVDAGKLSDV